MPDISNVGSSANQSEGVSQRQDAVSTRAAAAGKDILKTDMGTAAKLGAAFTSYVGMSTAVEKAMDATVSIEGSRKDAGRMEIASLLLAGGMGYDR